MDLFVALREVNGEPPNHMNVFLDIYPLMALWVHSLISFAV